MYKMNFRLFLNQYKKIIGGIFVILLMVGLTFFFLQKRRQKKENQQQEEKIVQVSLVNEKKESEEMKDSDGDGVADWVENLWPELDPYNPDSDGDGVSDLHYIQRKQQIKEKQRKDLGNTPDLTESQKLGRGIYMALLAVQQAGGTLDEQTQKQISKNIQDHIAHLFIGSKRYILDDLNIVEDTKENSYHYRDEMKKFFKKNPIKMSEIDLLIRASENPQDYMPQIEKAAMKYDAYLHDLAAMKVPSVIAGRHTELLNAVGQLEGAFKNLTREEPDEVVRLSVVVQIDDFMNKISESILRIQDYFKIIEDPDVFNKE